MAAPANVELTIHDIAGRLVARVVDGVQSAGAHEVPWELPAGLDADFKGNVFGPGSAWAARHSPATRAAALDVRRSR
jgi:hypothetical protein